MFPKNGVRRTLAVDHCPGCFYRRGLDCGTIVGLAITNCAH